MPKFMHQIVLFIEPNENEYTTPIKVGNKFMNLCAVDEDAGFEIVKILELEKISKRFAENEFEYEFEMSTEERKQKGIALIIVS